MSTTPPRQNFGINVPLKLAALWTSLMFLYAYADLLGLYDPELIQEILAGNMGFMGPITQELKLSVAVMMSIPAVMISLSLILRANLSRLANIGFGVIYALVILVTLVMPSWLYYKYFAALELLLTISIVWIAWKWPATASSTDAG